MLKLFKKTKYQMVIEFQGDDPETFNRVLALETRLENELKTGELDGNDVGKGIINIFIVTKDPKSCFDEAMRVIAGVGPCPRAAGYRGLEEEDYVRLRPEGDETPFELK
jgi:hypothetical protein